MTEPDIRKFIDLHKNSKERNDVTAAIRKAGDFSFNTSNQCNDGELVVIRRPKEEHKKTAKDFVTCGLDKGMYTKTALSRHFQKCSGQKITGQCVVMVLGRSIIGSISPLQCITLRLRIIPIIPILREDVITRIILYDDLIIQYGNKLCQKYQLSTHHDNEIRQKLRRLGRLIELKD